MYNTRILIILAFVNIRSQSIEVTGAFKDYVETAKIIRSSPSFNESFARKLENFLLDRSAKSAALLEGQVIPEGTDLSKCFIRISAPSLDGATQLAFLMEDLKPLYFTSTYLFITRRSDSSTTYGDIHENFSPFPCALSSALLSDVHSFADHHRNTSVEALNSFFETKICYTLGLLKNMATFALSKPENQSWMEFYLNLPSFQLSYSNIKSAKESLKGFALFIDGSFMLDNEYSIFLKTLAEAVNLPLIVMDTTSTPGKLMVSNSLTYTEGTVWSLNVTKLDPVSIDVLNEKYELSSSIAKLIDNRPENDAVAQFLREFNIKDLRAGIAVVVTKALKEFAELALSEFKLGDLLDFVCKKVSVKVLSTKPNIRYWSDESISQLFLFNCKSYADQNDVSSKLTSATHPLRFGNHFFCLRNPANSSNFFVAFPPDPNSRGESDKYERYRYLRFCKKGKLVEWNSPMSVFNQKEFLLMLGCMFIPFRSSMSQICLDSFIKMRTSAFSIFCTFDETPLTHIYGYYAALILARASNYTCLSDNSEFSVRGLSGDQFFKNAVYQSLALFNNTIGSAEKVSIEFPLELSSTFETLHIPFIYRVTGSAMDFEKFSSLEHGFFVDRYSLGGDNQLLEGSFKAKNSDSSADITVACETKSTRRFLLCKDMTRVLKNFETVNARIGVIFCVKLATIVLDESEFVKYCTSKRINIYATKMIEKGKSYSVEPYFISCEQPEMTCIVILNH